MVDNRTTLERNGFEVGPRLREERYWVSSDRDYTEDLEVLCRINFSLIERAPEGDTRDLLVQGSRDPGFVTDSL